MKAKDLRGRNIEELEGDSEEPKEEEDQVAAAYENISKKLESIRNGKASDDEEEKKDSGEDEEESEVELEEWKGPKPPKLTEEAQEQEQSEDDFELRKVKLRKSDEDNKEEEEELEPLPGTDEKEPVKEWRPTRDDPLDEDEEVSPQDNEKEDIDELDDLDDEDKAGSKKEEPVEEIQGRREETEEDELEKPESSKSDDSNIDEYSTKIERPGRFESEADVERRIEPQPDTLDDLTEKPERAGSSDEDEYEIPHLKGSRHEIGSMGYNTLQERGTLGSSYQREPMENSDPNNYFSQHQPQAPKRANKFHLLILVLIGVVVIGFTVYILKGGFGDINLTSQPSPSPSPVETPVATPTPTPEAQVDRGQFTIRVLNGTSTTGLAATVSDKLEELGYKTSRPGNATNSAFTQTIIRVKEGSESANLIQRLIADLAPDYQGQEGAPLDNKAAYDAEVTLGK